MLCAFRWKFAANYNLWYFCRVFFARGLIMNETRKIRWAIRDERTTDILTSVNVYYSASIGRRQIHSGISPILLEHLSRQLRLEMHFQQSSCTSNISRAVREVLNTRLLGKYGPTNYLSSSHNLTVMDYYSQGLVKDLQIASTSNYKRWHDA